MGSDHCPTVITINEKDAYIDIAGPSRFKLPKTDWGRFKGICNETLTREITYDKDIDVNSRRITEVITSAARLFSTVRRISKWPEGFASVRRISVATP